MRPIEIARRCVELDRAEDAARAYALVIHQSGQVQPEEELEAAMYLLRFGPDHKAAYTTFVNLYNRGLFHDVLFDVLTDVFYKPNEKMLKNRYEKNCKRLAKYKLCFKKDFLPFEKLPVRFFPYDENGFVPYYVNEDRFGAYVNINEPVISRNFFRDLEKPVFASDVYSQYELSYLRDNVRRSDWVARENHVYLHYSDFAVFCAYLQVLNLRPLLEEEKLVFLMEEERALYPIDFKERFGIDYSQYTPREINTREVTRLIWNCQLSSHNGGDFFNEILDEHPNLLVSHSILYDDVKEQIGRALALMKDPEKFGAVIETGNGATLSSEVWRLRDVTEKDLLVATYIAIRKKYGGLDNTARIVPAMMFQPHFKFIYYDISSDEKGRAQLFSEEYDKIKDSEIFKGFKYIKTFAPLRRITTSYGASVKYSDMIADEVFEEEKKFTFSSDHVLRRVVSRNYLADPRDRLFKDSVIVRFEDAKLNPKATFSALAAFCDIPYTESMAYCSMNGERDPESLKGNDIGFSTAAVYRKYEDHMSASEATYIEYFMRDAYEAYGYDFNYYDGTPMDEARVAALVNGFDCCDKSLTKEWGRLFHAVDWEIGGKEVPPEEVDDLVKAALEEKMRVFKEKRMLLARALLKGLHFVSRDGQPLRMLPLLKPDETLLEQPLYR